MVIPDEPAINKSSDDKGQNQTSATISSMNHEEQSIENVANIENYIFVTFIRFFFQNF